MNGLGVSCGVQYAIYFFMSSSSIVVCLVVYFRRIEKAISRKLRVGNAKRSAKNTQKYFERTIEQYTDRITDIGKSVFYCRQCTNDTEFRRERK